MMNTTKVVLAIGGVAVAAAAFASWRHSKTLMRTVPEMGALPQTCTGWRLGISPTIWSVTSRRERPMSGTDCVSRKCNRGDTVVRYTVCRVPQQLEPRVRVYENTKETMSFTASSFDEGKRFVDRMIGR